MKNSGVEWIGEIPDEWEVRKFKYFFDIYGGSGFKEEYQGQENGDFPFCKASDINGTEKNLISAKNYVNQDLVDKESYIIIPKNSILVSKIGEALKKNHRKVNLVNCIVDNNCEGFVLNSKNDINYLYYVLKCIDMSWFDNGGTIPSINNFKLKNFLLPNCLYETQQRIASYLDKKCSKIEETIQNQQQVIEKLKAYKQSLITEAVTGKVKIVNGKACGEYESYKDSGVEWIGKIPNGWNLTKIAYITTKIGSGKTPNGGAAIYIDEGVLFIRSQNVYNEGLLLDEPMFISDEIDDDMKSTRLANNDVLLNITGGSIGRCCIYEKKYGRANVNQHVCIIRVIPTKVIPKFMQLFWISKVGEISIDIYQTGGNREGMSGDAISKTLIPLPSMNEQKEIADYLDKKCTAIDTAIEQKQELIEKLTEYKKSLIYECVTGKKEIS